MFSDNHLLGVMYTCKAYEEIEENRTGIVSDLCSGSSTTSWLLWHLP